MDWEASTFTRILFDGILTDFDKRLSVDFVDEVGRARSYSIESDDARRVLSYYYHSLDYRKRRAQLREERAERLSVEISLLQTRNLSHKNEEENLEGLLLESGRDKYDDPGDGNSDIAQTPKADDDFPEKLDASTTQNTASLSDIQHHKNRIEFLKLLIAQTSYNMELFLCNTKAVYLAHLAYGEIEEINTGSALMAGGGRLSQRMAAARK